jgi:hypothetical protein
VLEPRVVGPDGGHLREDVTRDHGRTAKRRLTA